MNTEITIIDPKEFGLKEESATSIQQAFAPKIIERDELAKQYEIIIKQELTPETLKDARSLRLQLVKVRTGIAAVHKNEKEYSLSYGRFVDAWKNKETLPVSQMEENLQAIEDHFENIEKERIQKVNEERKAALLPYVDDVTAPNLGEMDADVWDAYFSTKKKAFEDKVEAERQAEIQRQENIRLDALRLERTNQLAPYSMFIGDMPNLREMSEAEYSELLENVKLQKQAYDKKQEETRLENEKLKADAEARELELAKERKANDEKLAKERAEKEKAESELKARKDAEALLEKQLQEKIAADKKEAEKLAKAPIKKQLIVWVNDFSLPESPMTENATAKEISAKFEAFKNWALQQVENL